MVRVSLVLRGASVGDPVRIIWRGAARFPNRLRDCDKADRNGKYLRSVMYGGSPAKDLYCNFTTLQADENFLGSGKVIAAL